MAGPHIEAFSVYNPATPSADRNAGGRRGQEAGGAGAGDEVGCGRFGDAELSSDGPDWLAVPLERFAVDGGHLAEAVGGGAAHAGRDVGVSALGLECGGDDGAVAR